MAKTDSITKPPTYSARATSSGTVELVIERERVTFVEEVIPDGQMAGLIGHREVPSTDTFTFELYPQDAQALLDDIGSALDAIRR